MSRIWALVLFQVGDLIRSVVGLVPLAAALAFGLIAFEYGMDQAQFGTVGGVGIATICFLTMLVLASRANRAASYLLLGRLRQRAELLAALVLSSLGITGVLALLITAGNLMAGRLSLSFPSALWILPAWLALWLLASALALPLTDLVGRGGSNLAGYVLLTALLVANERREFLVAWQLDWLIRAIAVVLWPFRTLLERTSAGIHDRPFFLALALTLACAAVLFSLAVGLLDRKDLLWAE